MHMNVSQLQATIREYLNTKVTVTITDLAPSSGATINPSEDFTFVVRATNAAAAHGGLPLKNVKYHVLVEKETVAKVRVPRGGTAVSRAGQPLQAGAEVGDFVFQPAPRSDLSLLAPGETDLLTVTGKAGSAPMGGTTAIKAWISADIDLGDFESREQVEMLVIKP